MSTFIILLFGAALAAGLSVFGQLTKLATPTLASWRQSVALLPAPPKYGTPVAAVLSAPSDPSVINPPFKRADALVSGILGLLFFPLEGALLFFNTYILSLSFETLFDGGGVLFSVVLPGGLQREITALDGIACVVSLSQLIVGSIVINGLNKQKPCYLLIGLGVLAVICLVGSEVWASISRGLVLEANGLAVGQAWLGGLIALGTAITEVLVGVFVFEHFLAAFIATVLHAFMLPFRVLNRWIKGRDRCPKTPPVVKTSFGHAILVLVSALDEGCFSPFRCVDAVVGKVLQQRFPSLVNRKNEE